MSLLSNLNLPAYATRERFNSPLFIVYVLLHLSIIAAPFTYTQAGLIAFMVTMFCTMCMGVTLCYHRLLAHRSYKTYRPVKFLLALIGCLAFQRGPVWWVAAHRLHHSAVDTEQDPHYPSVSWLWSHALWPFFKHPQLDEAPETTYRLARDIADDPMLQFLETHYTTINVLFLILLFYVGYWLGGWQTGLSVFVWGGLLRLVYALNITWCVNAVCHLWGYQTYKTPDNSRNNWLVGLLAFGEGWHNNHHMDQRAARNGHQWFEIDVTYYLIRLMGFFGLAFDFVPVKQRLEPLYSNFIPEYPS